MGHQAWIFPKFWNSESGLLLKAIRGSNLDQALGVRVNQSTNYLNFSGKDDKHTWGTAVLILWSRCPCSLVDKGSWTGAIFWRSFCDVTLTSNVISSRLGSTLSGQMIRIRDRLIGSQSSQKCKSFLLRGSFYSASEIPWGRIGVNGSTLAYSNLLIFIGPKSNHCLSLSVNHCCKLQCNAMYTIHGDTY